MFLAGRPGNGHGYPQRLGEAVTLKAVRGHRDRHQAHRARVYNAPKLGSGLWGHPRRAEAQGLLQPGYRGATSTSLSTAR